MTASSTRSTNANPPVYDGDTRKPVPLVRELFRVHHLMMRVGDRLTAQIGLTASRWMLLCALEELGETTVGQLSERAMLSPQAVSRMLAGMDSEGIVARGRHPDDARVVSVRLTAAGIDAHRATLELAERFRGPFLDGLTNTDAERITADLDRLTQNLARFEQSLTLDETERVPTQKDTSP